MKRAYLTVLISFVFIMGIGTKVYSQSLEEYGMMIENRNGAMKEAMLSKNIEALMKFYAEDVISLPNESGMIIGIDEMRKFKEELMKSDSKVVAFEHTTKNLTSCGKQITEVGTFKMSIQEPEKKKPTETFGKYVTIWENYGERALRIKVEIWNSDYRSNKLSQK